MYTHNILLMGNLNVITKNSCNEMSCRSHIFGHETNIHINLCIRTYIPIHKNVHMHIDFVPNK